MLRIAHLEDSVSARGFGGKAVGLHVLFEAGLEVPYAVFIEATPDPSMLDDESFLRELSRELEPFRHGGRYCVAIRSSSTREDAFAASLAGRYSSVLGEYVFPEVIAQMKGIVEDSLAKDAGWDAAMGLVVQELVEPDYSGVAFSSDPVTYSRRGMVLSYVPGMGEKLVAGESAGRDLSVRLGDDGAVSVPDCDLGASEAELICRSVKSLEESLGYPVDVEWALAGAKVRFLQCRPLAAITGVASGMFRVAEDELRGLPYAIRGHDKVAIRIRAASEGVPVSDAALFVSNRSGATAGVPDGYGVSDECCSVSVVLTYPEVVGGKVRRSFVGTGSRPGLYRAAGSAMLSSSGYDALEECLADYFELAHQDYWVCAAIAQEVFDPVFTGVARADGDTLVLELIRGHFFTKGIVPPSRYVVEGGEVTSRAVRPQDVEYRIESDAVYERPCADRFDPSDEVLLGICETFSGVVSSGAAVEFGVLGGKGDRMTPYLIDFVDEVAALPPPQLYRDEGVISDGFGSGVLVCVGAAGAVSLDAHYHDSETGCARSASRGGKVVLFAPKPDIALASALDSGRGEVAAAVFESGSLLCHLAVVLRERGIPAVVVGERSQLSDLEGSLVEVDAHTRGIEGRNRVRAIGAGTEPTGAAGSGSADKLGAPHDHGVGVGSGGGGARNPSHLRGRRVR